MERKVIGTHWNRGARNDINDDLEYLFRKEKGTSQALTDLVLEAGDSNPEVVQARGGEQVLNDRLNKVDDTLNTKSTVVVSSEEPTDATVWFEVVE